MTLDPPALWSLDGRAMARWSTRSRPLIAGLRRRMATHLRPHIRRACTHVRGHGGVKGAVRGLAATLDHTHFVARFDIKSYYESMRHDVLLNLLREAGVDGHDLALTGAYLRLPDARRTGRGIVAGGGLSPLLGALYLAPLDRAMLRRRRAGRLVHYVRYMDDIVLVAGTRWQLRRAIAELHAVLRPLHLTLHPIKRFVGRATRGFDFLGYQLHPGRKLRASRESLRRLRERARRLYEREADVVRLRQYVQRWQRWLFGGLDGLVSRQGGAERTTRHILAHLRIPRSPNRDRDG